MPDSPIPLPRRKWFTSDKEEVVIPGAGIMGMGLLLMSLGMLFAASLIAYLVVRFVHFANQPWPPPGFPLLPKTLWISTLVILATSVTIQLALNAIKRGHTARLTRWLGVTFGLGMLFLGLQLLNWWEFYAALPATYSRGGIYLNMFYVLTGLHALHVIGGLIPLGIILRRSRQPQVFPYAPKYHPGITYSAMYWHFLDAVWVALFVVVYLI